MTNFIWYCDPTKNISTTSALCEPTRSASGKEWTTATCCGDAGQPNMPCPPIRPNSTQFDPIRPNSTQFETRILGPCFLDEAFFRTFYAEQTTPLYQPLHPTGLPDYRTTGLLVYRTTGLLVYRTTGLPVSIVPPCLPSRNARAPATRAVATTPRPASESDGATRPAHAAENERHTTRGSPVICTWSAFWPVAKICKNIEAVV